MHTYLQELQDLYRTELGMAALTYLEIGLVLFHGFEPDDFGSRNIEIKLGFYPHPQTALGNLAIAVELMLKAFVASKHLSLLFRELPLEIRTILTCQDSLPADFNWRLLDIELRSANYKSIDFGECVTIFYVFYPEWRWLESPLKILRGARNASLHAFLPSFQQYELEQAARVALQIHDILQEVQIFGQSGYKYSHLDELFVNRYDEEEVMRVRSKIDASKKRSKTIDDSSIRVGHALGDWTHFVIPCPVCQCDCMLDGEITYMDTIFWDEQRPSLRFEAEGLKCLHCGLALNNGSELKLAGIHLSYDRIDEIDLYRRDKGIQPAE